MDSPEYSPKPPEKQKLPSDKDDFIWTKDLSPNAQKLYLFLLGDVGFTQQLPTLAKMQGINLEAGLEELRRWDLLNEEDPAIILLNILHKRSKPEVDKSSE